MTDEPFESAEVTSTATTEHMVTLQDRSSKRFFVFPRKLVYTVLAGFLVAICLGTWAFYNLFDESQQQVSLGQEAVENLTEDVTLLRQQLGEAQRGLTERNDENNDLVACRAAFNNHVSEMTSNVLIEQTQLIAAIAADIPLQPAIDEIEVAGQRLLEAQFARANYEENGATLPCPLTAAG